MESELSKIAKSWYTGLLGGGRSGNIPWDMVRDAAILTAVTAPITAGIWEASRYARQGALALSERDEMLKGWKRLHTRYPDLTDDPNKAADNFAMYKDLYQAAPSVMRVPSIAISLIRTANGYATGGLDVSSLQNLTRAESQIQQARSSKLNVGGIGQVQSMPVMDLLRS